MALVKSNFGQKTFQKLLTTFPGSYSLQISSSVFFIAVPLRQRVLPCLLVEPPGKIRGICLAGMIVQSTGQERAEEALHVATTAFM